jgi:hypothetical protein
MKGDLALSILAVIGGGNRVIGFAIAKLTVVL